MTWLPFHDMEPFTDPDLLIDPWKEVRLAHRDFNTQQGYKALLPMPVFHERVALVGGGRSLERFWPKLKDYSIIFTTSIAHDFLVDRGICPTYHVDTEAGAHKVDLITPCNSTLYILSLRMNPNYFKRLKQKHNKIVVFDHLSYSDEHIPSEYPTFPVTCHGGHTMMLVAYFMGFYYMDFFGFDFNRENGQTTDMRYTPFKIEFDGHQFETDKNLLAGAIIFYDILASLPHINVEIYTDGLLKAMMEEKQTRSPNAPARNRVEPNY